MSIDDNGLRPLADRERDEWTAITAGLRDDITLRGHEAVAPNPPRGVVAASLVLGCTAIGAASFLGSEPLATVVIVLVLACTLVVLAVAGSRRRG